MLNINLVVCAACSEITSTSALIIVGEAGVYTGAFIVAVRQTTVRVGAG